jgi:hypothetical protein
LYSSNINRIIQSGRLRWASTEDVRIANKIVVRKVERRLLGRRRSRGV